MQRLQLGIRNRRRDDGDAARVRAELRDRVERHPVVGGVVADRKSTRLNSSHVSISYAVFCLKKTMIKTALPDFVLPCTMPTDTTVPCGGIVQTRSRSTFTVVPSAPSGTRMNDFTALTIALVG